MIAIAEKKHSFEAYLEFEKTSEIRHEFIHGKLLPMSGESKDANRIALNLNSLLESILEEMGFEIFLHDVRTMIKKETLYRYPDLVIAPESDDANTHAITKPILIAEVISEGTANTDRGEKLQEYCNLPSLQYYLIIEQKQKLIELYSRKNNQWVLTFYDTKNNQLKLEHFNVSLPIEKIYKRVKFKN